MSSPIIDRLNRSMEMKRDENLLRETPQPLHLPIDFRSNSYLSLQKEPELISGFNKRLKSGAGNGASRLVSSESTLFTELEELVARWKKTESALIFNSGYAANCGVIQAICRKDTAIFHDRLNHASLVDGTILSRSKLIRYKHRDLSDLQKRLRECSNREKIIATDSIFSMDGDIAPLYELTDIARREGALLLVDEAHAVGIFGQNGAGVLEELHIEEDFIITVGTFSKAHSGMGGYIAASNLIRQSCVNGARSFIYSTALPESVLLWNYLATEFIIKNPQRGKELLYRSRALRERLNSDGWNTGESESQIIPLIVEDSKKALLLSRHLKDCGIGAVAIRPPTVPINSARVRISLNSSITKDDEEELIYQLKQSKIL